MPVAFLFLVISALVARYSSPKNKIPRLVWGSDPIINNKYWSRAMIESGYSSQTFTFDYYESIGKREDWDILLSENFKLMPMPVKRIMAFAWSLFKYDVFFISFNGFFIGGSVLSTMQAYLFKIARKKTVLIPYGSDYFSYRRIRSTSLIHGLLMSYPDAARKQKKIGKQVDYWVRNADVVIPGTMGPDGAGRWDVLSPSSLCIDLTEWQKSKRLSQANGVNGVVYVVHAPNHRGFKGSEFVVEAVKNLCKEGLLVELILLEKIQNSIVKKILNEKADILVEQLIATGHGFNAVEGMASGLTVISNLEDTTYTMPFRRWSFLGECPIVSASPETIAEVLRKLITRPDLRKSIGDASRNYAEKYHSYNAASYLFKSVLSYLNGEDVNLLNLYHPLLGSYSMSFPVIKHPLIDSRLPD